MVEPSNAPSFTPLESMIKSCIQKYPAPTEDQLRQKIDLKNVSPQPIEHFMVCKRCKNFAYQYQ